MILRFGFPEKISGIKKKKLVMYVSSYGWSESIELVWFV